MSLLHRKNGGGPIREAIKASGLTLTAIAAATRGVDDAGRGVSKSAIGMLAGEGDSARERCRIRTAWLMAVALDAPLQDLFSMPTASTSTKERATV